MHEPLLQLGSQLELLEMVLMNQLYPCEYNATAASNRCHAANNNTTTRPRITLPNAITANVKGPKKSVVKLCDCK